MRVCFLRFLLVCFIIESMHYTPATVQNQLTILWLHLLSPLCQYSSTNTETDARLSARHQYTVSAGRLCIALDGERSGEKKDLLKYFQHAFN